MEEVKQSSMNQKFQLISLFYSSEVWSLQHRGTQALQFIPADCRHLAEDLKLSHHPSHLQVRGERATSKGQRLIISFYQHTGLYIETSPDHQSRTGNMLKTCLFFFFWSRSKFLARHHQVGEYALNNIDTLVFQWVRFMVVGWLNWLKIKSQLRVNHIRGQQIFLINPCSFCCSAVYQGNFLHLPRSQQNSHTSCWILCAWNHI